MQEEFIGYEGLGNDIEFRYIKETLKAIYVKLVAEPDVEIWIPKSGIEDDGSLNEYGCKCFHINYSKAIGE